MPSSRHVHDNHAFLPLKAEGMLNRVGVVVEPDRLIADQRRLHASDDAAAEGSLPLDDEAAGRHLGGFASNQTAERFGGNQTALANLGVGQAFVAHQNVER